ncbi:CLUMA_CG019822, isoform A [Clunio marinus]|uniref:CLUMA_CG019822, isoform A n=1 Tax=Clunio marinus TaxID=568069 RepID=A0A1J1J393_9DIPT|nr:CLUMA_CG019822, isoform A [Clunio marinus]
MTVILVSVSLFVYGCLAMPLEISENRVQKRSIGEEFFATPSISTISLGAPTITSHTHTHSTAIIDRPVAYPAITSTSILPSTTYNFGLGSYPYSFGYSFRTLGLSGRYYSDYGKFYPRSFPSAIYKKSFYSSPVLKYKW